MRSSLQDSRERARVLLRGGGGALRAHEPALVQQLGDLDGVRGGALAEVVGDDPEIERALVAAVAADASDEHAVLAGGVDRERVERGGGVVEDGDAGRGGEQLACALGRELLARLHVDGLGVAVDDGHAHARGGDADREVVEDLARLVDELELLVGVVLAGGEAAGVRQRVERDLVRVRARRVDVALVQQRVRLVEQLVDGALAGAGDRLVGADDEPLDAGGVVDGLERDDHLHGRAVGVGDYAGMRAERIGVDLADDERHVVAHAPARGVVDDGRAGGDEPRRPLAGGGAAGGEQPEVEAPNRLVAESLHGEVRAIRPGAREHAPGGALGGERHDLARGELALAQQAQHQRADLPGGADDGYAVVAGHARRVPGRLTRARGRIGCGQGRTGTMCTSSSSPAKSRGLHVNRGSPAESATAAMSMSIARRPRGLRPAALAAVYTRPYARAAPASNGSGSNVASVRCRRSCRRARSEASSVAWGPAASSATVIVEIAISCGSAAGSSRSRSITTDVSSSPRVARSGSGTRCDALVERAIDVRTEALAVDRGRAGECLQDDGGGDEPPSAQRVELAYGHAVARDDERFAAVEPAHNLAAVVAQLALGYLSRHEASVARVRHALRRWGWRGRRDPAETRPPRVLTAPRSRPDMQRHEEDRDEHEHADERADERGAAHERAVLVAHRDAVAFAAGGGEVASGGLLGAFGGGDHDGADEPADEDDRGEPPLHEEVAPVVALAGEVDAGEQHEQQRGVDEHALD